MLLAPAALSLMIPPVLHGFTNEWTLTHQTGGRRQSDPGYDAKSRLSGGTFCTIQNKGMKNGCVERWDLNVYLRSNRADP